MLGIVTKNFVASLLLVLLIASSACIILQRNFCNSALSGQHLHGHFNLTVQNADVEVYLLIQLLHFVFSK